ncbi:MAG: efflux RND transporter periplasmic adaptor subunit [Myxococcota bacterium]
MTRWYLALALLGPSLLISGCSAPGDAEAKPDAATAGSANADRAPQVRGTRVEVAVIQPTRASLDLRLPGEVEAGRDANLSAPLGGFIEKVTVAAGDEVRAGQILALVDTASHGARQAQAQVELDTAKRELERQKKLGRATTKASVDNAQSRYDAARAAMQSAAVSVRRSVIKAPFAGVLASVDAEAGETASPGIPLMRLIQVDPVKVSVSLSDRDVGSVRVGMPTRISLDARGEIMDGTVTLVKPAADTRTRTFVAEVAVENPDRTLLPGMIANVRIAAELDGEDLVIAQDWLVTKPDSLGVFVQRDGAAVWRPVTIGGVVRDRVIVNEGLSVGDELVITGHRDLADGDALIVARKGQCCTNGRVVFEGDGATRPASAPPPAAATTTTTADGASAPEGPAPAAQKERGR